MVETLTDKSETLIQWMDLKIHGIQISSDDRTRISASCHDMVMEHHKSIVILILKSLYGSAFSLVRPIFETYIRGVWIHRCASNAQIEKFKEGKLDKTFNQLVKEIEDIDDYDVGVLSNIKKTSWGNMCGYTHSGFNQVVRRMTATEIKPNYDYSEIKECLYFASAISLLSAAEVSLLGENENLGFEFANAIKQLVQENK